MILKSMTVGQSLTSKGMLAGYGLVALGAFLVWQKQYEFGVGVVMNGLGIMGIRDAKQN